MNRDGDTESPLPLFFSLSASFKNSGPKEKVENLSSFWDWWAKSFLVSIIITKYYIFSVLTMAANVKRKFFLSK